MGRSMVSPYIHMNGATPFNKTALWPVLEPIKLLRYVYDVV
jgi:hypothetical protein